ncbi:MAG: molybdopterin cofactor-binding domain-containing protein, partial [Rhodoblastus sp.]|uniref:molybdopterin cofactor-binding domain-containing protein n=1 Tax=Rhodoblastus sp. TaxID=1962975 RepID=UPI003FD7A60B
MRCDFDESIARRAAKSVWRHTVEPARCAFTNTITTAPYRGAGLPEANYVLERVVEEAARVTGIDPAKLRRRNL